jgi:hypothetical protein
MVADDTRVHFRYYDAVNGLIGRHRWRYEVMPRGDVEDYTKSLVKRGFGEFAWRELTPSGAWHPVVREMTQ